MLGSCELVALSWAALVVFISWIAAFSPCHTNWAAQWLVRRVLANSPDCLRFPFCSCNLATVWCVLSYWHFACWSRIRLSIALSAYLTVSLVLFITWSCLYRLLCHEKGRSQYQYWRTCSGQSWCRDWSFTKPQPVHEPISGSNCVNVAVLLERLRGFAAWSTWSVRQIQPFAQPFGLLPLSFSTALIKPPCLWLCCWESCFWALSLCCCVWGLGDTSPLVPDGSWDTLSSSSSLIESTLTGFASTVSWQCGWHVLHSHVPLFFPRTDHQLHWLVWRRRKLQRHDSQRNCCNGFVTKPPATSALQVPASSCVATITTPNCGNCVF